MALLAGETAGSTIVPLHSIIVLTSTVVLIFTFPVAADGSSLSFLEHSFALDKVFDKSYAELRLS